MENVFDESALLQQAPQGAGTLQYRSDLRVRFYLHAVKDEIASHREKRPIYVDSIYLSSKAIGTKDFMSAPASPEDIAAHPAEWSEFQSARAMAKTSIRLLPRITPAVFLTLQELGIETIEDFAESTPTSELVEAHAVACRWIGAVEQVSAPKKGGWPKGKPRKGNVQDAEAAA